MNALRRCIRSGTEGIIVIECTWPGSTVSMLSRSCTHTHTYIYNSESAIEIEHPIYSSFFLLFFFLSPLAMDRRIAFSLLSISIHLSIVAFHAYYNYFWFIWSPWDNRNWNSFQSLVVLRWILDSFSRCILLVF